MSAMSQVAEALGIRFEATPQTIDGSTIVRLPETASLQLPSRGQVAVQGAINGHRFQTVLEPDGCSGHWMKVEGALQEAAGIRPPHSVTLEIESVTGWPEPDVPEDLAEALAVARQSIRELWKSITPMARWEWVRWINATKNPETRKRRVDVTISKMSGGKRRPCCFNLASCTDPELSRNGKLFDPE